jgi:hypothetical protein
VAAKMQPSSHSTHGCVMHSLGKDRGVNVTRDCNAQQRINARAFAVSGNLYRLYTLLRVFRFPVCVAPFFGFLVGPYPF